jgi:Rieske Fe-S protein
MTPDIKITDLKQLLVKIVGTCSSVKVVDLKRQMAGNMGKQKSISRKLFIQTSTGLVVGLTGWIWYKLTGFQSERENSLEFRHEHIAMGISYFDKYYIYRTDHSVRAFLTKCTHAGCRIGMGSGNVLRCNCHGSQFEGSTGKPIKGPAIRPLQQIECFFDEAKGLWVVRLHPHNHERV